MVNFVGIDCTREALATELYRQLREDKSMCPACYLAHRTLARSILRSTKPGQYARGRKKDMRAFDAHWKMKDEMYKRARKTMKRGTSKGTAVSSSEKRSIKRGMNDIRAGRVITEKEFLKKHPELK